MIRRKQEWTNEEYRCVLRNIKKWLNSRFFCTKDGIVFGVRTNKEMEELLGLPYTSSSRAACEANDRKFGKVDLYDYVCKEKQYPILHGIYHKDGKVYATDRRILCRCVCDYDSKYEDKVVGKDGNVIEGCYPDADRVIPNTQGWTHIPIDFNKVEQSRKKWVAHKKIYKKAALGRFAIGNQFIDMPHFFMMCDLMKEWGITEVVQCTDSDIRNLLPLVAEEENNKVILIPVFFDDEQLSAPEVLVIGL